MIEILLGDTYYNKGFFNIGIEYENLIGEDNALISIQLGDNPENVVQGYINRTANQNHTPRIMGGIQMKNWIQENFELYETLNVQVFNPQSIKLMNN